MRKFAHYKSAFVVHCFRPRKPNNRSGTTDFNLKLFSTSDRSPPLLGSQLLRTNTNMSERSLQTTITAPNGRVITLSTGLFIGNEFVKGSGNGIETTDPA